ncbi:MAG TPA: WD40 repeat domain-containing protein [Gemmata sp.]
MHVLSGHTNRVNDIAFSLDGRQLASCSTDGTVRIWDCLTGTSEILCRVEPSPVTEISGVRFVNGPGLVVRPRWRGLQVWDVGTRARVGTLVDEAQGVPDFAVHPAGRLVAAHATHWSPGTVSRYVRVWSALNWALIDQHQIPFNYGPCGLAFDPSGTRLATAVGVIDSRSGALLSGTGFPGETLLWSPDGRLIAGIGGGGKAVGMYEAATGKFVQALVGGVKPIQGCAFSADGRRFVTVSNAETVRSWDTRTWEEAPVRSWGIGKLKCVAFSPDGTRAACGGHRGAIVVWDLD